jgi:hypothetical protein
MTESAICGALRQEPYRRMESPQMIVGPSQILHPNRTLDGSEFLIQ